MIRSQIKEYLLEALYATSDVYFNKQLEKIIDTNNLINGFKTPSPIGACIYKATIYNINNEYVVFSKHSRWKPYKTYPLDPSLHTDMDAYLDLRQTLKVERPLIERFLTVLLNFCKSTEDIKAILGDQFYGVIKEFQYYLQEEKQPEDKIMKFKQDNQHYIDTMYQRHIDNVLMTGVYNES